MSDAPFLPVVLGVALATYAMRLVPGLLLAGRPLPPLVVEWMGFVPIAVMAAMVAPTILCGAEGALLPAGTNPALIAAVPTVCVAWACRNFMVTVVVSVLAMAAARALGWG